VNCNAVYDCKDDTCNYEAKTNGKKHCISFHKETLPNIAILGDATRQTQTFRFQIRLVKGHRSYYVGVEHPRYKKLTIQYVPEMPCLYSQLVCVWPSDVKYDNLTIIAIRNGVLKAEKFEICRSHELKRINVKKQ